MYRLIQIHRYVSGTRRLACSERIDPDNGKVGAEAPSRRDKSDEQDLAPMIANSNLRPKREGGDEWRGVNVE